MRKQVKRRRSEIVQSSKLPSKVAALAELLRLTEQAGTMEISRDYFRANSRCRDKWNMYWPSFKAYLAAGMADGVGAQLGRDQHEVARLDGVDRHPHQPVLKEMPGQGHGRGARREPVLQRSERRTGVDQRRAPPAQDDGQRVVSAHRAANNPWQ